MASNVHQGSDFTGPDVVVSSDGNGVSNAKTKSPALDVFSKSVPTSQVADTVTPEGGMSGDLGLSAGAVEGEVAFEPEHEPTASGSSGNEAVVHNEACVEGENVGTAEHETTASGSSGNEAVVHNEACVEGEDAGTASGSYDVSIPPVLDSTNSSGSCSGELLRAGESVVSQAVNSHPMLTRSKMGIFKPKLYSADS
ncbi:hypothetical protein V6N13_083263 [Hibiscus sabdariffa]